MLSETLANYAINLAYETFPADAAVVGDGAMRVVLLGGTLTEGSSNVRQLGVKESLEIIVSLLTIFKMAHEWYVQRKHERSRPELEEFIRKEVRQALGRRLNDHASEQLIRQTVAAVSSKHESNS